MMMRVTSLLLLVALGAAQAASFYSVVKQEWDLFKATHMKTYAHEHEEALRMKVFIENWHYIASHNTRYEKGEVSFKLKMNHFGDLLRHEYTNLVNGYRNSSRNTSVNVMGANFLMPPAHITLPDAIDWRDLGAVTPVKNQGQCGSCWAFSTTGALEGQHFRQTGKLVSLSEQNLVDCSGSYGNQGCNGGLMDNAFQYIKDNGGIDTEEAYPYQGDEEKCEFKRTEVGAEDTGFVDIPQGNEHALKAALATVGPVSIAIDASQGSFQFYHTGVYYDAGCSSEQLDHGVLAVGYGVDADSGEKYWLVKNSWDTQWGDEGYIRMARDRDNACGVASAASYPTV